MKVRTVFNLINGSVLRTDTVGHTREEAEKEIADVILPRLSSIEYFNITSNGHPHIVLKDAVTDFYIEEVPEAPF